MATGRVAASEDDVIAGALPGILKPVGMQVYNGHPVWNKISKGNRKRPWEGESIQAAVVTSTYAKASSYTNDDVVNLSSVQPVTAVQFEMGGYQTSVNLPLMKVRRVKSSPQKFYELLSFHSKLAIEDMMDLMSTHFLQTSNDAKGILSLDTLTDASTTIAGLAGSSTWGGTTTASGSFASQGKNDLMTLKNTLSVYLPTLGTDGGEMGFQAEPDTMITRRQEYQFYWNSLESGMRYTPNGKGDVGFSQITFDGVPIIRDQHCPSGRWHVFRASELYLYVSTDADFLTHPPVRPVDQPDTIGVGIVWNGQVVCNTRRHFGKLTGLSA